MIYDETSEKVEIPSNEFATFARLNTQNSEILRQKYIRDQLRSLNKHSVKYDEFYYDKKQKEEDEKEDQDIGTDQKSLLKKRKKKKKDYDVVEDLNKLKDLSLQIFSFGLLGRKEDTVKAGIFRIETILPDKMLVQGYNIFIDVKDKENLKKKETIETIKFESNEICINAKNFKYTKLNIILLMNDEKIKDDMISENTEKKVMNRYEITFKRYIDEITLSSLFVDMIYDNINVTIVEIFLYFLKFEKRKKMKLFPFFHLDGLLFVSYLWKLCNSNCKQGFWFIFFFEIWALNKQLIEQLKIVKYFNPDFNLSICYHIMDRKVNFFLFFRILRFLLRS